MNKLTLTAAGLVAALALSPGAARAAAVLVSSDQLRLPEQIVDAPGGGFLVADATNQNIVQITAGGGSYAVGAVQPAGFSPFAITRLGTDYGTYAGQFAAFGVNSNSGSGPQQAEIALLGTSGLSTPSIQAALPANSFFGGATTAPAAYGTGSNPITAGSVVLGNEDVNEIDVLNPSLAGVTAFTKLNFAPLGLAFAPAGFGKFGGDLFVSDLNSGRIYVVLPDGSVQPFADLPLPTGFKNPGLRQIAFAPSGFDVPCATSGGATGSCGGDLFVSVASQNGGGGNNGYIEALDPTGALAAGYVYQAGASGSPLEPRGLLFEGPDLIVANADPGLDQLTPQDFVPAGQFLAVPEPAAAMLLLPWLTAALASRRRR